MSLGRILIALSALALGAQSPVEQRLRTDLAYLTNPALRGRGQGTPGLEAAAQYLVESYRRMGLSASIQRYPVLARPQSGTLRHADPDLLAHSPNVVVVIPGSDPALAREYLALGAHFDHLGEDPGGLSLALEGAKKCIHPGADDNASGTALVLELARQLREHPPRRSILLLHFSGEEVGLQGSAYWSKHATVPLQQVKFFFNFDMVGRLDPRKPKLDIGGIGVSSAAMALLDRHVPREITLVHELGLNLGGSDHLSIAAEKIPSVFYFTGLHGNYHRPSDTLDKLNIAGEALIEAAALGAIEEMADAQASPAFDSDAARCLFPVGAKPTPPLGLLLGSPGPQATELGLQAGDILLSIQDQPIRTLLDLATAMEHHTPGDRVKVTWSRRGQIKTAEILLKRRGTGTDNEPRIRKD